MLLVEVQSVPRLLVRRALSFGMILTDVADVREEIQLASLYSYVGITFHLPAGGLRRPNGGSGEDLLVPTPRPATTASNHGERF